MNKTISIIRIAILLTLAFVSIPLILGEEQDENILAWLLHFVTDKAVGFALVFLAVGLYKRWKTIDPWLIAYDKFCDTVMHTSNPTKR